MSPEELETSCGLGQWRPKFLQALASKKVYIFFYGAIGIIKVRNLHRSHRLLMLKLQGMQYSYMSSILTTIEKEFGIKSKETAYLNSGNEIAQILFIFFLPLMMKVKKRPLWCGIGMMTTALGLYMMALPHLLINRTAPPTTSSSLSSSQSCEAENAVPGLCNSTVHLNSLEGACDEDGNRNVQWPGLTLFFLGLVLTGVGNSLFWCFGMVYLDDNSGKENSPFMLSMTFVFRLIGPTFGYLLGTKCLSTYVSPGQTVDYGERDPRWIGAWWIGFPVIGTLLLLCSIPLTFFPQRLPKTDTDASKEAKKKLMPHEEFNRDSLLPALKRLLTNKLYVTNFFSTIFYVFAFMGFGTFMPKYIEYQFRMKASTSSRVTGLAGTAAKAVGLLVSGWLVGRFKFSARTLSIWNVILGFCYFGTLILFSIVSSLICSVDC